MPRRGLVPMVWVLIDPDGGRHKIYDLSEWARQNVQLFFPENPPENAAQRICMGFQPIARGMREPERKHKAKTYKKWTLEEPPRPRTDEDTEDSFESARPWVSIGDRFGALTIIDTAPQKVYSDGGVAAMWKVYCRFCGKTKVMSYAAIKRAVSCGCVASIQRKILCHICWKQFSGTARSRYCPECKKKYGKGRAPLKYFEMPRPDWAEDLKPELPPAPKDDLSGKTFGSWKVLCPAKEPLYYICRCEKCGSIKSVYRSSLLQGTSTQCLSCAGKGPQPGISKSHFKKACERYVGKVTNGWLVLEVLPNDKKGKSFPCRAICPKCGKETVTRLTRLSKIQSCAECSQDLGKKASAIAPIVCADGSKITSIQSRMDGKVNKNSSTGVNGVTKRESGKYFAYINFKRKQIGLGMYDKLDDAIAARKKAEELIYAPYLEAHEGWKDDLKKALEELKKK